MRRINANMKNKRSTYKGNILVGGYMFPFCILLLQFVAVFMIKSSTMFGKIKIDLPKGKTEIITVSQNPIAIFLKKEGLVFVEDIQIRLPLLPIRLNEITSNKNTKIFILADKEIIYEKIVDVVSIVYGAGFHDVTLVTELKRL
jgi:biopolymer transport protein ExbD